MKLYSTCLAIVSFEYLLGLFFKSYLILIFSFVLMTFFSSKMKDNTIFLNETYKKIKWLLLYIF